jgi:mono/diheme cytochrome c family protein
LNGTPNTLQRASARHSGMNIMSRRRCARTIGGLLTLIILLAVSTAYAADPGNGERLARQWCASCHLVARDQTGPTSEAPPFPTLAARTDLDAAKIALFLLDPHPRMPNMELTREEAADLAAYIESLK